MIACIYSEKYLGSGAPTCNYGDPCQTCTRIWVSRGGCVSPRVGEVWATDNFEWPEVRIERIRGSMAFGPGTDITVYGISGYGEGRWGGFRPPAQQKGPGNATYRLTRRIRWVA